jgi:hypothetical protein
MLRAMFSGRMEVLTDSDGWILIDRQEISSPKSVENMSIQGGP